MNRTWLFLLIIGGLIVAACGAEPAPAPTEALPTQAPTEPAPTEAPPTQAPTEPPPTQAPTEPPPTIVPTETTFESPVDMPNPASRFCTDQGNQWEIRTEAGGEVGYCLFPDGSECEEWAFYRGECQPGTAPESTTFESPVALPNPASKFCEDQGYQLEIRTEASGSIGYCLFPDGSECEEWAYYRGECAPGTPGP